MSTSFSSRFEWSGLSPRDQNGIEVRAAAVLVNQNMIPFLPAKNIRVNCDDSALPVKTEEAVEGFPASTPW